ncbi:MAG: cobyrinate a,c-diamide synthase [Candidatus Rokubacteria bacterium]|nr:cobyrinate a,c-diamide synthase [Candidatus Rokubacteria bacterium]
MSRVVVIAGTASGVGKTTVTLGLLGALRRRGLTVQAFKVGPDFIDPGLHEAVTGRPSWTLDGWMCGREHVRTTVATRAADADLAVVEGMMGCFDGAEAAADDGSTAQIAKWLGAPVVLVADVGAQARSVAAVVLGFARFDPGLRLAGVIANRVAGEHHARIVREAVAVGSGVPVLGAIPSEAVLILPERHLGLVTAAEGVLTPERRERLADVVERHVDLDRLVASAAPLPEPGRPAPLDLGTRAPAVRARLGVARDEAFHFYYPENLARLRAAGAELVFWSPLHDGAVPAVDGLYFGGGYPELHARTLAENHAVLEAVAQRAAAGLPIYAECGGLMYLARTLEDMQGVPHRMVGVLPGDVAMRPALTIGYREVRFTADTPLGPRGTVARGHEFHRSALGSVPAGVARVWKGAEAFLVGRSLLSYVHLHFGSQPALAEHFVAACAAA